MEIKTIWLLDGGQIRKTEIQKGKSTKNAKVNWEAH